MILRKLTDIVKSEENIQPKTQLIKKRSIRILNGSPEEKSVHIENK